MLYLHPQSLSPDPTYGREPGRAPGNRVETELYPHELLCARPEAPRTKRWKRSLDLFKRPPELTLEADVRRRVELLFDFGTEIDGQLALEVNAGSDLDLMACFGESEPEAAGLVPGHHPNPTYYWHVAGGNQRVVSQARGFRFVRLVFSDVRGPLRLRKVAARASFTFRRRQGDFQCSDPLFQRVWQSSVYTARLCTKEDTIWDGIKRDRHGWYGDARIIKLAVDNVFFDPRPAEAMLAAMPADRWTNDIPNYSFDGIAMLKQHILHYGADRPCVRPCYRSFLKLLDWAWRTQTNRDGLIIRTDRTYFGGMGFLDWAAFPDGGRFEELGWLQCKYLEALRDTRDVALVLRDPKTAARLAPRIAALERLLVKRFWNAKKGFVHTLNRIGRTPSPNRELGWAYFPFDTGQSGMYYRNTYVETYGRKVRLGPSGASRQSNALAAMAGLATPAMAKVMLARVFDNPRIDPIITPYFMYYEQLARAICGDPAGAIMNVRNYIGRMLVREDAATLWEIYDPDMTDMRKYRGEAGLLWTWPKSLCHGWGAGAVPIAAKFLLGIAPAAPGFASVAINPCREIPWTFTAKIPTPRGIIHVVRETADGTILYTIPKGIHLTQDAQDRAGHGFQVTRSN